MLLDENCIALVRLDVKADHREMRVVKVSMGSVSSSLPKGHVIGVNIEEVRSEPNMAAGANLERELLRGFEESCAAVFFITQNFTDERYLAAEVDYAVIQKRKKDRKFAIITQALQFSRSRNRKAPQMASG